MWFKTAKRIGSLSGVAALAVVMIAGCGGSSSGGKLTVAVFQPFSGADANFGPVAAAGSVPAVHAINAAGGVLGHQFASKNVDTRGDPADAVPAADQLLATTGGSLVAIQGPTSDEASATVPIFNHAGIPMNAGTGQTVFSKYTGPYFWRNTPPDDADGAAIGYYASRVMRYTRAAAVFANDISSQGAAPSSQATFKGLGGQIVADENLASDAASYETEVAKVIAAKPQVIFTEADPQSSATFFRELQNAGGLRPFIGTDGTIGPEWKAAVSKAIGAANFNRYYKIVQFGSAPSNGTRQYDAEVRRDPSGVNKPVSQWVGNAYAYACWDFTNQVALAMLEAKSVDPHKFNAYISRVTAPSPGAVVVDNFAAGKAALASGKHIQYVGGLGVTVYNRYHNSGGTFLVNGPDETTILSMIPGSTVTGLLAKYAP